MVEVNDSMTILIERTKALIADHDISQKILAASIKLSESKLSHYLTGKYEMPSRAVLDIAQYFHVTTDYLFGLTDDPKPPLTLSASERSLVELFRTLGRDQKELLLSTASFMQKQNQR